MKMIWTSPLGEVIDISPPSIILQGGWEGFSNVATVRQTARTPYGHGQFLLQTLYEPRELLIPVMVVADSPGALDALKERIIRAFAPGRGHGSLRWERDDGLNLTLSAEPKETPTVYTGAGQRGKSGLWGTMDLHLIADDPFWYSDQQVEALGAFEGAFALPFSFPFGIGSSGPSRTINNDGHLEAPMTLEIYGPCTNPVVTNHTTGAWFAADLDLHANEVLVVSADPLAKRVTRVHQISGTETNELNAIRTGSSWLDAVPGPNLMGVSSNALGNPISVTVLWFARYAGA